LIFEASKPRWVWKCFLIKVQGGGIEKEISVHLLAYNLIHPNIANAAPIGGVKLRQISFMAAAGFVGNTVGTTAALAYKALMRWLQPLLKAIGYAKTAS